MKEISWAQIIQGYRDHITNHNLRVKTTKQLQEENIRSCQTCNPAKRPSSIVFSTFFSVASQNLLAQSYTTRTVALFKQVLAALKEEKGLTGGIIEIINELLTTFIYKAPPTVTERRAAIFIRTLIQKTNGFERAPTAGEVAELISVYTIIPKNDDLKELIGTPKFTKASNWTSTSILKPTETEDISKMPDSETSLWNTLGILKNTSELNFLSLNEEENNPWIPSITDKLISPSRTPDMGTPLNENKTPKGED